MIRRSSPNSESPNKRFQAFEFGADDKRVEKHSAEMIAKFRSLAKRKSARNAKSEDPGSPMTKYSFLQLFTKKNPDKELSNQLIDVDGGETETTKTPQEKIRALLLDDDSHRPRSSVSLLVGTVEDDGAARNTAGVDVYDLSSCSNQKNKQVCSVSDDDDKLKPPTLIISPSKNGDPLQEQSSEPGAGGYESVEEAITNLHLESKESGGAGDANNTSGIEIYPYCGKGRDAIKSLDFSFNFDQDIIYPKGDPDAVSISKKDLELLQPETFINDTIVDFYIQYLKSKIHPEEKRRFHFFNSFFFRKLADVDKDQSSYEAKAAFQRVHKWTRKVGIFEKDYIFIPVNKSLHWSLIVVCHPGEVANVKDDESLLKVPCILHMDSIKGSHRGLNNLIQSYLCEEWKERHGETAEDVSLKFLNLKFVDLQLPQQGNSFDCGLFLLHYVERFLEEAPIYFSLSNIRKTSKFLKKNWFLPEEASVKRSQIKKLLCTILKDHSREALVADSMDKDHCSHGLNNTNKQQTGMHFPEKVSSLTERFYSYSSSSNASGTGITILGTYPPFQEGEDSEDHVSDSVVDMEDCQKGTGLSSDLFRKSYCWQGSSWKHGFPNHLDNNVDKTRTSGGGSENLSALGIDQDYSHMENKPRNIDASESFSSEESAHWVVPDSEEENDNGDAGRQRG